MIFHILISNISIVMVSGIFKMLQRPNLCEKEMNVPTHTTNRLLLKTH
jgi:hypothetical protein